MSPRKSFESSTFLSSQETAPRIPIFSLFREPRDTAIKPIELNFDSPFSLELDFLNYQTSLTFLTETQLYDSIFHVCA